MNILEAHKKGDTLEVQVNAPFNLQVRDMIESRLGDEVESLNIDLSNCQFLDSEAVIFMFQWQRAGKKLQLANPPALLFEILEILELSEHWQPDYIETNPH